MREIITRDRPWIACCGLLLSVLLVADNLGAQPMAASAPGGEEVVTQYRSNLPCGPAAMAIALQLLRVPYTDLELAAIPTTGQSTSFLQLDAFAKTKHLHTLAVRVTPEALVRLNRVCIVQVTAPADQSGKPEYHFSVVAGPVGKGGMLLFDPAAIYGVTGPFRVDEFAEFYTGKALVLSKYPIPSPEPHGVEVMATSTSPLAWATAGGGFVFGAAVVVVLWWLRSRRIVLALALVGMLAGGSALGAPPGTLPATMPAPMNPVLKPTESRYVKGPLPFDAGVVPKGATIRRSFEVVNPDAVPRHIAFGEKTCQCLEASMDGPPVIAPGSTLRVTVAVNFLRGGIVSHGVLLNMEGVPKPIPLLVAARVKDDTLIASEVNFGDRVVTAEPERRPLPVINTGVESQTFSIVSAESDCPAVSVQLPAKPAVEDRAGLRTTRWDLSVVLEPGKVKPGRLSAHLRVVARAGSTDLCFTVYCLGTIQPNVSASPSAVFRIADPAGIPLELVVRRQDGQSLAALKEVCTEQVDAKDIKCIRIGEAAFRVSMTLVVRANTRVTKGRVIIRLQEGEVVVPVTILPKPKENS